MNIQTKHQIDLTVKSFAYVAKKLTEISAAQSATAPYEQIQTEAKRHRHALLLVQRDVFDRADQELRNRNLNKAKFDRLRKAAAQTFDQALATIGRIAAQYSEHRLAA
jgi:hypothetical protein